MIVQSTYRNVEHFFLLLMMFSITLMHSTPVHAQTIGDMILGTAYGLGTAPFLLQGIAYLLGIGFGVYGILKFKQHVDQPAQYPLMDGVRYMLAATFFVAIPIFADYVIATFGLDYANAPTNTGLAFGDTGSGFTVDGMLQALALDISMPMMLLFDIFAFVAGIILLMIGIHRITAKMDQGARSPVGLGTLMHFVVAAVLMSGTHALGAFSETIFGTSDIKTYAVITSDAQLDGNLQERAQAILASVQTLLTIIGIISFIKGWFVLKSASDGNSQATMMSGFTHIIAGVIAVNIGPFINAVQLTFGLDPANGLLFR